MVLVNLITSLILFRDNGGGEKQHRAKSREKTTLCFVAQSSQLVFFCSPRQHQKQKTLSFTLTVSFLVSSSNTTSAQHSQRRITMSRPKGKRHSEPSVPPSFQPEQRNDALFCLFVAESVFAEESVVSSRTIRDAEKSVRREEREHGTRILNIINDFELPLGVNWKEFFRPGEEKDFSSFLYDALSFICRDTRKLNKETALLVCGGRKSCLMFVDRGEGKWTLFDPSFVEDDLPNLIKGRKQTQDYLLSTFEPSRKRGLRTSMKAFSISESSVSPRRIRPAHPATHHKTRFDISDEEEEEEEEDMIVPSTRKRSTIIDPPVSTKKKVDSLPSLSLDLTSPPASPPSLPSPSPPASPYHH